MAKWETPNSLSGDIVGRAVVLDTDLDAFILDVFGQLADPHNWRIEEAGDMTPEDTAALFQAMIDIYLGGTVLATPSPKHDLKIGFERAVVAGGSIGGNFAANTILGQSWFQSTPALNDNTSLLVNLAEGTYLCVVEVVTRANGGIAHIFVDGVDSGTTIDTYSASTTINVRKTATITMDGSGEHTIEFKMSSKNASSTGYQFEVIFIQLDRTGD